MALHLSGTLLYCLVNNDIGIDFSDLFTISVTSIRGHMYKLYKPHATYVHQGKMSLFSIRAVNPWNSLPDYVVMV